MVLRELWRDAGRLVTFGDSITVGAGASAPGMDWATQVATLLGAELINAGRSGTVLQSSADAGGTPRDGNGLSRIGEAMGGDRLIVLYGYNDARYTAAPSTFNVQGFERDYRTCIERLLLSGYEPRDICIGSPPYIPTAGLAIGSQGFTGQSREGFEAFVTAVRRLALAYRLCYAPVYEAMSSYADGALASADTTHPSDRGHRVIAEAALAAVQLAP